MPGPITGGVLQALTLAGSQNTPVTVSTSGDTNVTASRPFLFLYQRIIASAGSYTRNITLDSANAVLWSVITLDIELAGSSAAIIRVYDQSTGGTKIEEVAGRADARYYLFQGRWNGTNYEKLSGAFQL